MIDIHAIESRYTASGLTPDARLIDERFSDRLGGGWYLSVQTKKNGDSLVNNMSPLPLRACEALVAYAEDVPALVAELRTAWETIETLKAHLGRRT